jgi:hypothetical protein
VSRRPSISALFDAVLQPLGLIDDCPSCGGLKPNALSVLVVEYGTKPTRCDLCGLVLGPAGRAVGLRSPIGEVRLTIVALGRVPEDLQQRQVALNV